VVLHRAASRRALRWVPPALLVALVLTLTFQAWVAALVALTVLGFGLQKVRFSVLALALAGGLVVMSGALPAVNQLIENRIHPTGSAADEYAFRAQLWPAAERYASHAPLLGAGPGQFNQLGITGTVRNQTVRLVDDNTFTAKLVETGYPGLLLLVVGLVLIARRMLLNRDRGRAWAGLGALLAWVVMASSVEVFAGDQVLLPCWLMLGMLSHSPRAETA
jgi:O-antigen ligase